MKRKEKITVNTKESTMIKKYFKKISDLKERRKK